MKKIATLLIAFTMLLGVTGCSSTGGKTPATADIIAEIKEQVTLPEMAEIPQTDISFYTQLKEDDIEEMSYLMAGSGITADEVLVVKMKDGIKMDEMKTMLETRKSMQSELFEPYAPDEMPKLESAVIEVKGNYAIFAVTADNAKVKKIFSDSF